MSQYVVYLITCATTGKRYIGLTKLGAQKRLRNHVSNARSNRSGALYAAIRKYGREAFNIEVLRDGLTQKQAEAVEIELIALHGTQSPNGYNITRGGEGAFGYEVSAKTRARMSQTHALRQADPALRARTSAALKGKPKTAEHNAKVAAANTGKTVSPEARAKIAAKLAGLVQSVETIEKRAAKLRGRKMPAHVSDALSVRWKNVPKTEEQKQKIRASLLGRRPSQNAIDALVARNKGVPKSFEWKAKVRAAKRRTRMERNGGSALAWFNLVEAHGRVSVRNAP